jgi:electron transfer flavoprotein alpha subunit
MTLSILVVTDQRDGHLKGASLEALSEARRVAAQAGGGEVVAALVGSGLSAVIEEAKTRGVNRVLVVDDEHLRAFSASAYAQAVSRLIPKLTLPWAIFLPDSALGRELAPRLGALLGAGTATAVVEIHADPAGKVTVKRKVFGGKATETLELKGTPVLSLRPNSFAVDAPAAGDPPVEKVELGALPVHAQGVAVEKVVSTRGDTPELTEAAIVVSGGRGLKGPENFVMVEDLAKVLGAAVGSSRAVVDAGWRPASYQVGQTGKIIAPQLYIAAGISGAIQHLVGITNSRCIVAINKDPAAPIFKVADYGLAGDALTILPALTALVTKSKGP